MNGSYKNASARFKNNLSTVLLFSAFAWFCVTLFQKYFSLAQINVGNDQFVQSISSSPEIFSTKLNLVLSRITAGLPYLSVAYLLLLLLFTLKLINSYRFTNFIKNNGLQKPAVEWKLFTERVTRQMNIAKQVCIWFSEHIDVPATIGFLKPVILIPLASVNQLSAEQMEAIILHELSHIKRNDYLINLFVSIIETILFFNPFVVLLAKIIKRERENCCDDFVIQYQYDRHSYASALLSLEQLRNYNLPLAISATSGKKQLLQRIKRIMEMKSSTNFNYGQKLLALLIVTALLCSIAWISPSKASEQKVNKTLIAASAKKITPEKPVNKFANLVNNIISGFEFTEPSKSEIKTTVHQSHFIKSEIENFKTVVENTGDELKKIKLPEFSSVLAPKKRFQLFGNRSPFADAEFRQRAMTEKELERLKDNIEKQSFYFSFDVQKMQDDIQQTLQNIQQQIPEEIYKNVMHERLKKYTDATKKSNEQKEVQFYLRDNNARNFKPAKIKTFTTADSAMFQRIIPQDELSDMNDETFFETVKRPAAPARIFQKLINDNNKINNCKEPKPHPEVKVQYRNGVLVINGKEIKLANTNKMLALLKKQHIVISSNGENIIEVNVGED